ncbi:MAG: hypothetical protein VW578_02840 [Flavobacteriaceae bacterium]
MKKIITFLILASTSFSFSQNEKITLEDFVTQHNGFEENENGEITPINEKEINKLIRFGVEQSFPQVERIRNIIWDSYSTFVSPFEKSHYHNFIVQVKMPDVERYRYVDMIYNPSNKKVTTNFYWDTEIGDFSEKKSEESEQPSTDN